MNPMLDATLEDDSRFNTTIPTASPNNSTFTIRKFKRNVITVVDLVKNGTITADAAAFLWLAIEGLGVRPANALIVGGTGSGKTTALNALAMYIPAASRIITIEDTAELVVLHANKVAMVSKKEANVTMDMLLRNALRMRPDRIIVGEVRGPEAGTLFEAMNTGHAGSLGTLHAESARETINRITNPPMSVPKSMLGPLDLIIVFKRLMTSTGNKRIIQEISEVNASGGMEPRFNTLYEYDPKKNKLVNTGIPSRLRSDIATANGMTPKQFDHIHKDRMEIITQLCVSPTISAEYLFGKLDQLRFHWKEERKSGGHIDAVKSILSKMIGKG